MYQSPAWPKGEVQKGTHTYANSNSNSSELRARLGVNSYSVDKKASNRPSLSPKHHDSPISPTDAFFSRPSRLFAEMNMRSVRADKPRPSPRVQEEMQQKVKPRLSLRDLQATASPLAKELIEQITKTSETLYTSAFNDLSTLHTALMESLTATAAEDARVLALLKASHAKTTTPLSSTRMSRGRGAEPSEVGESVKAFKLRIDVLEEEIAALWEEWEAANQEVKQIYAELLSGGTNGGVAEIVQESLTQELTVLEGQMEDFVNDVWEEARTSEKEFSKTINSIMSSLLQQFMLE